MQSIRNFGYILILAICFLVIPQNASANEDEEIDQIYTDRTALYKKTEALTQIPWYYLAAIDQYERNIQKNSDKNLVSIQIPDHIWYGTGNLSKLNEAWIIQLFDGLGKDGNGDNIADQKNAEDVLYTMALILQKSGQTKDDIKIALWHYYKRDLTVQTILNTAKVFQKYEQINLTDRSFPIAIQHNYSYRSTWGAPRGFGGRRIHEGTDIFAGYGAPVLSTTYGVVELKGWNLLGGWRLGIRDINNIYHYYAHLNGFKDDLKVGQVVGPGDLIGTVGSSGYGPPGTAGKFPPHLHYGMYQDNGFHEWSFDPYPYLTRWERMSKLKKKEER